MKIDVSWYNEEKTIICYKYGQDWTWDDFNLAAEKYYSMAESTEHTVDLIADFSEGTPPPPGALRHFRKAQDAVVSRGGVVVVAGGGFLINTLVSFFGHIYSAFSSSLMIAESVEEAVEEIDKLRGRKPP